MAEAPNPYRDAARRTKAAAIADTVAGGVDLIVTTHAELASRSRADRLRVLAADLDRLPADSPAWSQLADLAGVRPPASTESRQLVTRALRIKADLVDVVDADPFAGFEVA